MSDLTPEAEELLEDYQALIQGGRAPGKARTSLLKMSGNEDLVEQVVAEYRRRTRRFIDFRDPGVLTGNEHIETWYPDRTFQAHGLARL